MAKILIIDNDNRDHLPAQTSLSLGSYYSLVSCPIKPQGNTSIFPPLNFYKIVPGKLPKKLIININISVAKLKIFNYNRSLVFPGMRL